LVKYQTLIQMKTLIFSIFLLFPLYAVSQLAPIANDDHYTILRLGGINTWYFNVLENDFDPSGKELLIIDITEAGEGQAEIFQDTLIKYSVPYNFWGIDSLHYRIAQKSDTAELSEWAKLTIEVSFDTLNLISCQSDHTKALAGWPVSINVLENDLNLSNDTLLISCLHDQPAITFSDDSIITYVPEMNHPGGIEYIQYYVRKISDNLPYGYGWLIVNVENNHSYDSININNINAGFNSYGMLFSKCEFYPEHHLAKINSHFEVPKGSRKHTMFTSNIWIGGMNDNTLHLAGERHKSRGSDYSIGPVSDISDSAYFRKWSRVWKISSDEISYHIAHYNDPDYEPTMVIKTWPGNGDVSLGQLQKIAPFCDYNENGVYEPLQGDYPLIRGDQAIFYVYNDDRIHAETRGDSMRIEIRAMAYAFDLPEDSALNNSVFLHLDIVNCADLDYDNTYLGIYADMDLGYYWDDYSGSDVENGYFYGYNSDDQDEGYYDLHPPAQSVMFLAGPEMDADGLDNPLGLCDESINGLYYGDGIIDNERLGMTGWMEFTSSGNIMGYPLNAPDYYNYLQTRWKDNTHLMFGGNGHPNSGSTDVPAMFMFPDESDSCNWGTGGIQVGEEPWNEYSAGNGPSDTRSVVTTGPFTFESKSMVQVDLAFVFARDFDGNHLDALEVLKERNSYLKEKVINGDLIYLPACSPSSTNDLKHKEGITLYPNPAYDIIFIETGPNELETVNIYNLSGLLIHQYSCSNKSNSFSVDFLESGFYFLEINTSIGKQIAKLVKL